MHQTEYLLHPLTSFGISVNAMADQEIGTFNGVDDDGKVPLGLLGRDNCRKPAMFGKKHPNSSQSLRRNYRPLTGRRVISMKILKLRYFRVPALLIALFVAAIAAFFILEQRWAQAETGKVLSALISQIAYHKAQGLGSGRHVQIVLQREAGGPKSLGEEWEGTWGQRWDLVSDRKLRFPQEALSTRLSFIVRNAFNSDIRAELNVPSGVDVVIMSRREFEQSDPHRFQKLYPNVIGRLVVSQPGINLSKTEAILYYEFYPPGWGGGGYVLMRKVNGVWRFVDEHETWTS